MKKLEPKQVPQFAALCILSAGTFGYFVVRLVTPSPAAAGTHPPAAAPPPAVAAPVVPGRASEPVKPASPAGMTPAGAAASATATPDAAAIPPPAATMRDPFAVAYVEPKIVPAVSAPPSTPSLPNPPAQASPKTAVQLASLPPAPVVSPLPSGLSDFHVRPTGISSLPVAPKAPALPLPAPDWTVTGVLQGDAEQVAILRNGEARRIVRTGDAVDGLYKVVDVTRSAVILRHGKTFYQLSLGATKAAPVRVSPAAFLKPLADPATSKPLSLVPSASRPAVSLARAGRSLIKMAQASVSPTQASLLPPGLEHVRQTDRPQADLRFLDDAEPALNPDAQTPPDTTSQADTSRAAASSDAANPAH